MLDFLGMPIEPGVSTGNVITWALILGGALIWWIRGMPERKRAQNEADVIENAEAAVLRAEFNALHKIDRQDIHDLRNRLHAITIQQKNCEQSLTSAHAENRTYKDDMSTLLFLIRLLISEVKRLDKDPSNAIIQQAEMVLGELEKTRGGKERQAIAAAADTAIHKAQDTVIAAQATVDELANEGTGK